MLERAHKQLYAVVLLLKINVRSEIGPFLGVLRQKIKTSSCLTLSMLHSLVFPHWQCVVSPNTRSEKQWLDDASEYISTRSTVHRK